MKKQYKALMLDLDGTTIPNDKKGMPSEKVKKAIVEANKVLHVGAITGRPYFYARDVIHDLHLTGPSIANGGAMIVDSETDEVIWEKLIPQAELLKILQKLHKDGITTLIQSKLSDGRDIVFDGMQDVKDVWTISLPDMHPQKADEIHDALKVFSDIAVHRILGWKEGTVWLQISHDEASKQHGIWEVAKILGIETHEIIGVGDSYNDFPLLIACGLKIAMGNAVPELKEIADYIAPTVDEDGVADVIEKFIL